MSGFAFTAATGNLQTDVAYGREPAACEVFAVRPL